MEACELLAIEVRLDRIDAELASELAPHVRAFARAYAAGAAAPPAPDVLRRELTLATARAALVHPVLADRGLALLRLAAPTVIESDPEVSRARAAAPSWAALSALAGARDAAARARLGRGAIELVHALHGAAGAGPAGPLDVPPPIAGWFTADRDALSDAAIARRWDELCALHGAAGHAQLVRGQGARPRAFVVAPGREVIAVLPPRVAAPAERFAVLHELGHAAAALAGPATIARAVDEAVAGYVARAIEDPGDAWYSALAAPARARRRALAMRLDAIERGLPALPAGPPISARPPWALWHDPGAQAAYVAAEDLAEAMWRAAGAAPAPGALAERIAAACAPIDRQAWALG